MIVASINDSWEGQELNAVEAERFKNESTPACTDCVHEIDIIALDTALARLQNAIDSRYSRASCLRLWSHFVRLRDGFSCVRCDNKRHVSAHHVCRKSFMPEASLQPGNGITLCDSCHKAVHSGYNGRPDMSMPMDAQGAEKLSILEDLYGRLFADSGDRGLLDERYYYLSDSVLAKFKKFQGFDWQHPFPGSRIEQAYLIWKQAPKPVVDAILTANGFSNVLNRPPPRGGIIVFFDDGSDVSS